MSSISILLNSVKVEAESVRAVTRNHSNHRSGLELSPHAYSSEITSRRSLSFRLAQAERKAQLIDHKLSALHQFLSESVHEYSQTDQVIQKKLLAMLESTVNSKEAPIRAAEVDPYKPKENPVVRATEGKPKSFWSQFVDKDGKFYKGVQIGKAVLGIGLGVLTVAAAVGETVLSGGTLSPIAVVQAVYGLNDVLSSSCDLVNAIRGKYDLVGEVNPLKSLSSGLMGAIGKPFGLEKQGEALGKVAYYAGSVTVWFHSMKEIYKSVTDSVGKVKMPPKEYFKNLGKDIKDLPRRLTYYTKNADRSFTALKNRGLDGLKAAKRSIEIVTRENKRLFRTAPVISNTTSIIKNIKEVYSETKDTFEEIVEEFTQNETSVPNNLAFQ